MSEFNDITHEQALDLAARVISQGGAKTYIFEVLTSTKYGSVSITTSKTEEEAREFIAHSLTKQDKDAKVGRLLDTKDWDKVQL